MENLQIWVPRILAMLSLATTSLQVQNTSSLSSTSGVSFFFEWQTTIPKRKIAKIPTFIFATSKSNDFTSKGQLWS